MLAAAIGALILSGCEEKKDKRLEVVLYSSIDEGYSRDLGKLFEAKSGIRVLLISDTEAAKSTGLVNRLIAEKARPRADVFWSGDIGRAAEIAQLGLAKSYHSPQAAGLPPEYVDTRGRFTGFAGRARLIIYNTRLAGVSGVLPADIEDLARPEFASRTCLANPLFGTTSMHAAALFEHWGDTRAERFFREFAAHGGKVVASNGEVRRRVAAGEFAFGLTDSDDVSVALRDRKPIGFIVPDQSSEGALLIPSAAVLIEGAPHPREAQTLVDFLVSADVERWMAASEAAHLPLRPDLAPPAFLGKRVGEFRVMPVDYSKVGARMQSLMDGFLSQWVDEQRR